MTDLEKELLEALRGTLGIFGRVVDRTTWDNVEAKARAAVARAEVV